MKECRLYMFLNIVILIGLLINALLGELLGAILIKDKDKAQPLVSQLVFSVTIASKYLSNPA